MAVSPRLSGTWSCVASRNTTPRQKGRYMEVTDRFLNLLQNFVPVFAIEGLSMASQLDSRPESGRHQ
jgi:hypothetical protein